MVSLSLMARLLEAVRPDARLVLVGDPGQLASIEAGAVLGDVVAVGRGVVVLERVHRFGGGIARLADAVRRGDADEAVAALRAAPEEVTWMASDLADAPRPSCRWCASGRWRPARRVRRGARRRRRRAPRRAGAFRLLCAHRRGPHGVATGLSRVEAWLAAEIPSSTSSSATTSGGRCWSPQNDYELGLYNGDTGVIVQTRAGLRSPLSSAGAISCASARRRLGAVDTVYAMTIHKSQGSQFDTAAVLLPPAGSRILTRELLYTAVTRARRELILVGTEEAVRDAVERPVARASGLGERLSA